MRERFVSVWSCEERWARRRGFKGRERSFFQPLKESPYVHYETDFRVLSLYESRESREVCGASSRLL